MFFAPFVPFFDPRLGRPSTPMEVYLRLMFLKFRYRLGYETLCREVTDSITWRRFGRIPLDGQVPHPTTLMKLTTRCGTAAVDACNEALLAKAAEAKLLHTSRLRADTTVVPANVAYPTDSGLLAKAVRRIATTGRRVQAAAAPPAPGSGTAAAPPGREPNRSGRSCDRVSRRAATRLKRLSGGSLGSWPGWLSAPLPRRRSCWSTPAEHCATRSVWPLPARLRAGPDPAVGRRRGRLRRAVDDLTGLLAATRRIAAQTRQRLSGTTPDGATRRVSLHDPDARPIAKGRLGRPVEFGYKAQVLDNDDGVVLAHTVERGNPADAPQLAPAVGRVITRTGRRPRAITADRGYGDAAVENSLHDLGVPTVVIPRKGRPGKVRQAHEHRRSFRRTVKWRTGSEARMSTLKRQYGWDRTRLDGLGGARIWTGHGVFAHSLVKIAALTA